jgi:polyhydroxyalkanoate synthesis repressor PhaR
MTRRVKLSPVTDVTDVTPGPAGPARLIRRYANRKLYDVRTSAYVALEDLAALVRGGETVQVVDTVSGEDITAQTLTQVILDEGRRGPSLLPTDLLHAALRRGGRALDAGRDAVGDAVGQLRHGVDDLLHQSIGRLSRVLPVARADEVEALRRQLTAMERTLADLVARQPAAPELPSMRPPAPAGAVPPSAVPDIGAPVAFPDPNDARSQS